MPRKNPLTNFDEIVGTFALSGAAAVVIWRETFARFPEKFPVFALVGRRSAEDEKVCLSTENHVKISEEISEKFLFNCIFRDNFLSPEYY